ncbi:BolA family protein [Oceanicella actignis]|uniref:BolA protein n=1 Tax=Oceanicella actignis TaxID=1189325 RepID=A0A1M7TNW3_9RHOB|nr:BolA family protein [Oceanicella actignis]TYO85222.1 BolA protein [Oceanicella actignis]SET73001.1 BolA protein [Oceanicella actignis]SHN72366.1 BolA protein [Oceanicella actignis]
MSVARTIREKLTAAFDPVALEVEDQSERHRGHAGWREGGETHFHVRIRARAFAGRGRVEAQRMVHKALAEELAGPIHALSLDLGGPDRP